MLRNTVTGVPEIVFAVTDDVAASLLGGGDATPAAPVLGVLATFGAGIRAGEQFSYVSGHTAANAAAIRDSLAALPCVTSAFIKPAASAPGVA